MKHEIDIFTDIDRVEYPNIEPVEPGELLTIVFHGGTFGNFLRYFLEKFSSKTPDIKFEPFTDIGTSHKFQDKDFSGMIQKDHAEFIKPHLQKTDLPICIILPTKEKHFLYLKKAQWFRTVDHKISPDHLWKKAVGEMPEWLGKKAKEILELYGIKDMAHFSWIPKFIVRDWYKLGFLEELEQTYSYQWFETFKNHEFFKKQKTFQLDLETFFSWEGFVENIAELNDVFKLDLDFDRLTEMKSVFDKGLELDPIRKECNLAEQVLEDKTDVPLRGLDVSTQAYIYAQIEKAYPDIQMPMTNQFLRDYYEIRQLIDHYPNWYRRKNPNIK